MNSNYRSIYVGNLIEAQSIAAKLKEINIIAVVKDEGESARRAGFASAGLGDVKVFVHKDEFELSKKHLNF
jgi:hypothetical protein